MITTYENRFNDSLTIKEKQQIVKEMVDLNLPELQSHINDFTDIINDIIDMEADVENTKLIQDIDDGKYHLYQCINTIYPFINNEYYYVRIDDMSAQLKEQWKDNMTDILENYISSIPKVIWVIIDNGLGTRRSKVKFEGDFDSYFKLN